MTVRIAASGGLGHAGVREVVLGRAVVPGAGGVLGGLTPDEIARLAFYAAVAGVAPDAAGPPVHDGGGDVGEGGALSVDTLTETARDVMALFGVQTAPQVRARYGMMLVRGAARVRARAAPAAGLRAAAGAVQVVERSLPYASFFAVEEYELQYQRFDGEMSRVINRAAFLSGDAVTVLPYDPVRDRVLLIEQFRAGPFARGDHTPWQLEAIAGRIDPFETPQDSARREAVEEAGLVLGALHQVAAYYPSTASKTEFLYSYVALCDLPDGCAGVFGVADEAEDIRGHLVSFEALMGLVASGEVSNAPLLISVLWLQRERVRLRG